MENSFIPFDLQRMFLGNQPFAFYGEILVRTILVYGYALLLIRWFGGRGIAQLSLVEFLLVMILGSAIGDAPFYPDVPLMHAFAVITVVMILNWLADVLVAHHPRVEEAIIGGPHKIVDNGIIDTVVMNKLKLGRSELFQGARQNGIDNLGAVRAAYLEPSGQFSFFTVSTPLPGLQIEPPWAIAPPKCIGPGEDFPQHMPMLCAACALPLPPSVSTTPDACPACAGHEWTRAVGGSAPDDASAPG